MPHALFSAPPMPKCARQVRLRDRFLRSLCAPGPNARRSWATGCGPAREPRSVRRSRRQSAVRIVLRPMNRQGIWASRTFRSWMQFSLADCARPAPGAGFYGQHGGAASAPNTTTSAAYLERIKARAAASRGVLQRKAEPVLWSAWVPKKLRKRKGWAKPAGSRECAPRGVPTIMPRLDGGHGEPRLLPTLRRSHRKCLTTQIRTHPARCSPALFGQRPRFSVGGLLSPRFSASQRFMTDLQGRPPSSPCLAARSATGSSWQQLDKIFVRGERGVRYPTRFVTQVQKCTQNTEFFRLSTVERFSQHRCGISARS